MGSARMLVGGLLAATAPLGSAWALHRLYAPWTEVRSSTGAWLLAQVVRADMAGSYAAASAAGQVPNTTYDPLYPFLLHLLPGDPVVAGHALSAVALGACAALLALAWRPAGPGAFLVAAAALLLPPAAATGALVRYDTLAWALVAGELLLLSRSPVDAWRAGGAGLLAGLAYLTREFTLLPALALLAAGLASSPAPRRRAVLAALAGLLVGACALPPAIGLSPLAGFQAMAGYAVRGTFGPSPSWSEVLLPPRLAPWLLAGGVGLLAGRLGPARRTAGLSLAAVAGFLPMLAGRQQSPQYYLLAHLLLAAGIAGWSPASRAPGLLLGLAVAGASLRACVRDLPALVEPWRRGPVAGRLHTEAWPVPPGEAAAAIDRAVAASGGEPLVVVSGFVENIDALAWIRHRRPVAFLFDNWVDRLDRLIALYDGRPVWVLAVEGGGRPPIPLDPAARVEAWRTPHLAARLHRLPGRPWRGRPEDHPCRHDGLARGACAQLAWLDGGPEGLRRWMREVLAERARLQAPGEMLF